MERRWAAWSRGKDTWEQECPLLIHCHPVKTNEKEARSWEHEISGHSTIPFCLWRRRFLQTLCAPQVCATGSPSFISSLFPHSLKYHSDSQINDLSREIRVSKPMFCFFFFFFKISRKFSLIAKKEKTTQGLCRELSPSLAAKNIISFHLVMSMCRVISCVVGRGCLLWPACSLDKTLLAFALLHFVIQGQTCLLFLPLHSNLLWWKWLLFLVLVLEGVIGLHRTGQC